MKRIAGKPGSCLSALKWLFCCFFLMAAGPVQAERVSVVSAFESYGQGWLFGARGTNETIQCWIAVPVHVTRNSPEGEVAPFHYTDKRGYTGQTDTPIIPDDAAAEGDANGVDLAFAKVLGVRPTGCLSRLGLPEMVYQSVINKTPEVEFFDMLATSFGVFSLNIERVKVDSAGGGLMRLSAPDMSIHESYLNQGLSGAIGTVEWQGRQQPFAMIVQIESDKSAVFAVRFDVVRELFDVVQAANVSVTVAEQDYLIMGMRIDPVNSSTSPGNLMSVDECWFAKPPAGEPYVELVIETAADMKAVRGVSLLQQEACSSDPLPYSVDQRAGSDSNWVRVADCESVATPGNQCRVDLRAPRQFRIRIGPTDEARISALQLY